MDYGGRQLLAMGLHDRLCTLVRPLVAWHIGMGGHLMDGSGVKVAVTFDKLKSNGL